MSASECRFVIAVAVVISGQVMTNAADITPPSEKQTPHNTIFRLTGAIETIGETEPDDSSSDPPLAFAFPDSVPPPPPVCRNPGPAPAPTPIEDLTQQCQEEGTVLPIERHVEYFGMPAPPIPNSFRCRGPHPDPRTFAAAVRHLKKCDQATCELFYALFPSLPQMPREWSVPISEQIEQRLEPAANLKLAGLDDRCLGSDAGHPGTPIEQSLAGNILRVDMPEDTSLPGYRAYPPTYYSPPPAPGRNWIIAAPGGGNALPDRRPHTINYRVRALGPAPIQLDCLGDAPSFDEPDITNHLAN